MSGSGGIELDWADGTYSFRLTMTGIAELEGLCAAPIADIVERVGSRRFGSVDIRETVRLGLIGGGLAPVKALGLVRRYIDEQIGVKGGIGLLDCWPVARSVLLASYVGFVDHPLASAPETGPEKVPETARSAGASTSEPPSINVELCASIRQYLAELASTSGRL